MHHWCIIVMHILLHAAWSVKQMRLRGGGTGEEVLSNWEVLSAELEASRDREDW